MGRQVGQGRATRGRTVIAALAVGLSAGLAAGTSTGPLAAPASAGVSAGVPAQGSAGVSTPPTRTVAYRGYAVRVPASWPVFDLAAHPSTCIRLDRPAVFLGHPGSAQVCPARAVGRTEAIVVEPLDGGLAASGSSGLVDPSAAAVVATLTGSTGHQVRAYYRAAGVAVTAWYGGQGADLTRALATATVAAAPAPQAARQSAIGGPGAVAPSVTSLVPASATALSGRAFDTCVTPTAAAMAVWRARSPYRGVGVYLGGVNAACPPGPSNPNLSASWVAQQYAAGWRFMPIYVGRQAPCAARRAFAPMSGAGPAAYDQGRAAAADAASQARTYGFGAGNIVYFDLEAYPSSPSCRAAVLAFLSGWTAMLHARAYKSGVYSSAGSGIADLAGQYCGHGYALPDVIWSARWNGVARAYDDGRYYPTTVWARHLQARQFVGGHDETYGGVTLNIDSDVFDVSGRSLPPILAGPAVARPSGAGATLSRWCSRGGPFVAASGWSVARGYDLSRVGDRVAVGDFNGDGRADLAAAYQYPDGTMRLNVWRDGAIYQGAPGWYRSGWFPLSRVQGRLVAGDFNGDRRADVAMLYDLGGGRARIYRWLSTGRSFRLVGGWTTRGYALSRVGDRMVADDFNGDGRADIAVAYQYPNGTFRVHVWLDGQRYQGSNGYYRSGWFALGQVQGRLVAGDFNGDRRADVAMLYDLGGGRARIYRWLSTGRSFRLVGGWTTRGYWPSRVGDRMAAGDVDGDGRADIAAAYDYGGGAYRVHVWLAGVSYQGNGGWAGLRGGDPAGRFVLGRW